MATLTSTGAVNLTSSTNWSPAQIPAAGDDLVIAAHTLTLDADFTGAGALGSVTFNNASSRLAISGTTRSVQATNGWILTGAVNTTLCSTPISSGMSVTLTGKWTLNAGALSSPGSLFSGTGGNLTLQTVGASQSDELFFLNSAVYFTLVPTSWTTGTLTTTGRINAASANQNFTIVSISSGNWVHQSSGYNYLGVGQQRFVNATGTATITWTGSIDSSSTIGSGGVFNQASSSNSSTIGQAGDVFIQRGSIAGASFTSTVSTSNGTIELTGKFVNKNSSITLYGSGGTYNYRSQSLSIASDEFFLAYIIGSTLNVTDLVVSNAGKFFITAMGGSSITASAGTSITNTTSSAQAAVHSTALDGKIVTLPSPAPTLPAVQDVAAGTSYGYAASPLTGTGLIMDPAILATAVRNGVNVTVNPLVGALSGRVLSDMTMNFYKGEVINTTITVVDSSRQPVNMSGMTLRLVFENATTGTDIASVTSFTITGAGSNNATFAVPSAVTNTVTSTPHVWSLRDTGDGNRVIAMGTVVVRAAASLD